MITRAEAWRRGYEQSRYLRNLPSQALAERLRWLVENIATLNPFGQVSAEFPTGDYEKLRIAFIDTLHEFNSRGETPPDGFLSGSHLPQPSDPWYSVSGYGVPEPVSISSWKVVQIWK